MASPPPKKIGFTPGYKPPARGSVGAAKQQKIGFTPGFEPAKKA